MPASSLDVLPEPGVVLGPDGRVTAVNDLAATMFGSAAWLLEQDSARSLGDTAALRSWLADDDGPAVMRQRLEGRRENDVPIVIDLSARRSPGSKPRQALCVLRELCGDRLAGEAQLYFDIAFENAPIGMALFNTDGEYIRINSSLCTMLGRSADELIGRRDQELTHPEDRQEDIEAAWRILDGEIDSWQTEKRFLRPDGSIVWAVANLTFLRSPEGHPLSWVGQFQDITEGKFQEARLQELADRDPLTGLHNRRRLEAELAYRLEHGQGGSLLLVDLNHFKQINDVHGHREGDVALVAVASLLRGAIREPDVVARIGGDEFALLLRDAGKQAAQALAGRIAETVRAQRFGFDADASLSASIGVATFEPGRGTTAAALLAEADRAMYRAKGNGSSRHPVSRRRTEPRGARAVGDRPSTSSC